MSKHWVLVVLAAFFEVGWVTGLKHADSLWEFFLTVVAMAVSGAALIYSGKKLPASTVYAVFVGLGTAGTVLLEMLVFSEPFHWIKVGLILLLVIGVLGLKRVTREDAYSPRKGDA